MYSIIYYIYTTIKRLISPTFQPPSLSTPLYIRYTGAGGSGGGSGGGGTSKDSGGAQTHTSPRKPFERLDEENSPARPLLNRISNQLIRDVCTFVLLSFTVYPLLFIAYTTVLLFVYFCSIISG